jgi:hypothetical protein
MQLYLRKAAEKERAETPVGVSAVFIYNMDNQQVCCCLSYF